MGSGKVMVGERVFWVIIGHGWGIDDDGERGQGKVGRKQRKLSHIPMGVTD
jgi:hypothetical protein